MSGKREASTGDAIDGPRQFKQTKLNFFTSAPERKPQKGKVALEEDKEDLEEGQSSDQNGPSKTTGQPREPDTESSSSPPPPSSTATHTTTTLTNPPPPTATTTMPPTRLRITDRTGDLFAAPANTLLIHACNTVGSWGGGIALAFRKLYPAEFRVYRAHCERSTPNQLAGTALLIPPQGGSSGSGGGHYIGCLFTSRRYGAARDSPDRILRATGPAMRHLMRLVAEEEARRGVRIAEVRMCRINSGLFAVPWERSKRALEEMELGDGEVPACAEDGVVEVVAWERE